MTKLIKTLTGAMLLSTPLIAQQKPNVILIYTDDQGALDMSCYGAKDLQTPNMDALAQKGVRFSQFYAAPISSPSRSSLMTGQFTRRSGLWTNAGGESALPSQKTTIAEKFKENGYATALIGKWHLGDTPEVGPNAQGFDYFFGHRVGCIDNFSHFFYWNGPNKHDLWRSTNEVFYNGQFFPDLSVREIKNFIHDNKTQQKPFFLYWASNMPHYPLQASSKWLEYYRDLSYPRNLYAAFVSTLDDVLGEVITFLDREGLRENTIIVFQSDNGHSVETRNHNGGGYSGKYRGAKFSLFEGGIRVPAIISWPGKIPQGEVRNQMAMNVDWFPTLVDLCQLANKEMEVDGRSLVPVLDNAESASQHQVLHFDSGAQWAVRKGDWKLIGKPEDPVNPKSITPKDSIYLTNVKMDISESENLIDKHPQIAKELHALRYKYLQSIQ